MRLPLPPSTTTTTRITVRSHVGSTLCSCRSYILQPSTFSQCISPRLFSTSTTLLKDEKSKLLLKTLGINLQKGSLKSKAKDENKNNTEDKKSQQRQQQEDEMVQDQAEGQYLSDNTTGSSTQSAALSKLQQLQLSPKPTITDPSARTGVSAAATPSSAPLLSKIPPSRSSTRKRRPAVGLTDDQRKFVQLNEAYDRVSRMLGNDIKWQNAFDEGKAFGTFPSKHFLDRGELLQSIPNTLNIFDPKDMARVEEVYSKLKELDEDKSVHFKYYKQLLKNYHDDIQLLIQEFNGISKKFKLFRRGELPNVNLHKNAFVGDFNLTNVPYNVIGFDRSLIGMPLRRFESSQNMNEPVASLPQEFIEDLPTFGDTISVQKFDADILESDKYVRNLDPRNMNALLSRSQHPSSHDISPEQVIEQLPGNPVPVKIDSVDNYDVSSNDVFQVRATQLELESLRGALLDQLKSNSGTYFHLFMYSRVNKFKSSNYVLYDGSNNSATVGIRSFPLLPIYSRFIYSIRLRHRLKQHLFKIFLINLEDEIEVLLKNKYRNDVRKEQRFLADIVGMIDACLEDLFRVFRVGKGVYQGYDAVIYSPYINDSQIRFKRIYWLIGNKRSTTTGLLRHQVRSSRVRKSLMVIKWKQFDYVRSKYSI